MPGRLVMLLVLLFAAPGASNLGQTVVALAADTDPCDELCQGDDADSCPGSCAQCLCCAHLSTALASAVSLPVAPPWGLAPVTRLPDDDRSCGDRAPPFRPPAG